MVYRDCLFNIYIAAELKIIKLTHGSLGTAPGTDIFSSHTFSELLLYKCTQYIWQ